MPRATSRRTRDELTKLSDIHAARRASLSDYERTRIAELAAVGVNEPLRNKVRAVVENAAGAAANMGKSPPRR
ncbi:hypothetical protein ACFYUD_34535 [Nocardia tengchongensis]|uniref:hypothetical protein n=1 Tax=Nocardia tengchongensis TaxID=2055889 RepID=UPI0036A42F86